MPPTWILKHGHLPHHAELTVWKSLDRQLDVNCRNTQEIFSAFSNIYGDNVTISPLSPKGVPAEKIKTEDNTNAGLKELENVLQKLHQKGIDPSKIAVLTRRSQSRSWLKHTDKLADYTFTGSLTEWKAGKGIFCSTIKSFKGLEADIVILLEAIQPCAKFTAKNLSMAMG